MSEWDAHVYCTCFQQGLLTTEPPYPRSALTVNTFGVVTLVGSADHAKDPEELWCWRVGMVANDSIGDRGRPPCRHQDMKVINRIFYWPGSQWHSINYPTIERLLAAGSFPLIHDLIYRPAGNEYPSGGIWVHPEEATPLLREARSFQPRLAELSDAHDRYFFQTLCCLLQASEVTNNPVIVHYNGMIDGAW